MKKHGITILLVVLFLLGILCVAFPFVSSFVTKRQQEKHIEEYVEHTEQTDETIYDTLKDNARKYNEKIAQNGIMWFLNEEDKEEYMKTLLTDNTEIMAYIEIPAIDCKLPIYHGTGENVLQEGIGHIEGSSLPIGSETAHCLLTGHCGLPTARMFTDLDQLEKGDKFTIYTLDLAVTYEVDKISIVEPEDVTELQIEEGMDYCTLITCTPYGINTHRLLVRGKRMNMLDE